MIFWLNIFHVFDRTSMFSIQKYNRLKNLCMHVCPFITYKYIPEFVFFCNLCQSFQSAPHFDNVAICFHFHSVIDWRVVFKKVKVTIKMTQILQCFFKISYIHNLEFIDRVFFRLHSHNSIWFSCDVLDPDDSSFINFLLYTSNLFLL